ncbi:MAG: HAMP domain-containing protein [Candidatus Latescibacteria bacterium]|nr:HAMP domain-containing protein [Candidatus Latescibacterota bacterium]
MVGTNIGKSARSQLGTKSILAVVFLLSAISITLTVFFVSGQKNFLSEELNKRALSLASNMAYNSQFAVLSSDITFLQTLISGVKKESDIKDAFITDIDGVILAHDDKTLIGQKITIPTIGDSTFYQSWLPTENKDIKRTITLIEIERKPADSDENILFSTPEETSDSNSTAMTQLYIKPLGYAILDVSLESMNRALSVGTRNAIIITLIMILLGALAIIYLVRSVAGPIYYLADATRAVAEGDLEQYVPITRSDEIGVLADSFNHMIEQLKVSREKIESWNRELETKVAERTTELEEKHNELEKAYEALKTLDKAKDDFLSLVSHELRTPLSSILLYSEMLLDGLANSAEDRNDFLTTIVENCKRLTRLINDVLDLSKIEAGRMPFNFEELNIKGLVAETLTGIRPKLENQSLKFEYDQIDENACLWGDRDKIIQVLTNITSNAIKFTPVGGRISVSLSHKNNMGVVAVEDTGKGIEKKDIPKVFDRFSQLESIDHHSEGTGLGMTISKSIIERMGGKIWIESERGKGTTVFFTLSKIKPKLRNTAQMEVNNGTQ